NELIITVVNDTHYNSLDNARKSNSVSGDFDHVTSDGRLYNEADAIFKAFLEKAAANESSYILIVGDITERGTEEQIREMTALLSEFEKTTGKKIFVVPGNHDVFNSSKAKFM
ncbi:MAG: metallophosphoesterase, partial [Clostridia bacterium]|nr:metallophosphoesterase [Clostridia bacterium]